ncbi:MAG TPA: hypothetical protein VFV10_02910 [Gammaproteobacteria bacterium]|nr:hypothetical protein [Gammaproteobacteria bacterium]
MKTTMKNVKAAIGVGILAACLASGAYAGCSSLDLPSAPQTAPRSPAPALQGAGFVRVDYKNFGNDFWGQDDAAIVGLWKIQFIAKGNADIPDDTVLDDGYATWHSDGTELMNSSRPPMTSSFCMGVWKQTGRSTFKLNHFALSWDPTGSTLIGPTNIRETVTVDPSGNSYHGTFTITQYSVDGTTELGGAKGVVTGKRIKP